MTHNFTRCTLEYKGLRVLVDIRYTSSYARGGTSICYCMPSRNLSRDQVIRPSPVTSLWAHGRGLEVRSVTLGLLLPTYLTFDIQQLCFRRDLPCFCKIVWTCTFHTKSVDTRKNPASLWLISANVSSRSSDAAKKVKFDPPGTETWSSLYEYFQELTAVIIPPEKNCLCRTSLSAPM